MNADLTGIVQGKTIKLDQSVPGFEGQRVRIRLETVDAQQPEPSTEEQRRLLLHWAAHGPQGPLDGADQRPDETN